MSENSSNWRNDSISFRAEFAKAFVRLGMTVL